MLTVTVMDWPVCDLCFMEGTAESLSVWHSGRQFEKILGMHKVRFPCTKLDLVFVLNGTTSMDCMFEAIRHEILDEAFEISRIFD